MLSLQSGLSVFHRIWEADSPRGYIVGVHGFAEHSGRYREIAEYMASHGFTFSMYDLRGHGKTSSGKDNGYVSAFNDFIDDTNDFINEMVQNQEGTKIAIYGHSMGGLIVLDYLSKYGTMVDCAVTSGAATVTESGIFTKFLLGLLDAVSPRTRVKLPIKPENLTHVKEIFESYANDPLLLKRPTVKLIYELYSGSKSIWPKLPKVTTPILMLHGSEDKVVPVRATEMAFERIGSTDKQKKIYPGMYHEIHNETKRYEVYEDIYNWIRSHLG